SLSTEVACHGGNASRFRRQDRGNDAYPAPDPVTWRLYSRLKESFDPARVLNPGRLYREL
ncbi:MAG: glycolate oxidase subunit GlcE, partial [Proteobacteria bacterium]